MKKAVIATGGKQYVVGEGDEVEIELIDGDKKTINFDPLLIIDGDKVQVGTPIVSDAKVTANVLENVKEDKVVAIRYKAKKRVNKVRGHRQQKTKILISKIS